MALEVGAPVLIDAVAGEIDQVGYYRGRWSEANDWGAGRYVAVGEQDLLLSFDVEVGGRPLREVVGG